MKIQIKIFELLSVEELYEILQLRSEVFVLEQDCLYQDIDGSDSKAWHVLGKEKGKLIAYARYFLPAIYAKEAVIGRLLVQKSFRGKGHGHAVLKASLQAIYELYSTTSVCLSAQQYLIGFYESHGFITHGNGYLEDGIPHILMLKKV